MAVRQPLPRLWNGIAARSGEAGLSTERRGSSSSQEMCVLYAPRAPQFLRLFCRDFRPYWSHAGWVADDE